MPSSTSSDCSIGQNVGPGHDRPDRVRPEEERRHDAEVAAAAADRPVEIRVLVRAGAHLLAVGRDDVGGEEVVDRQAVLAGQVPEPAAEGQAAHAGGRDDPARHGEIVRLCRIVDVCPRTASADARRARLGVDDHLAQQRQVADDAVVHHAQATAVVPAAAHREEEVVRAGERDRAGDVVGPGAAGDQGGAPVDHRVVDLPGLVVLGILGPDQLATKARSELLPGRVGDGGQSCSYVPPCRVRFATGRDVASTLPRRR